jgi:hypothetical protein
LAISVARLWVVEKLILLIMLIEGVVIELAVKMFVKWLEDSG